MTWHLQSGKLIEVERYDTIRYDSSQICLYTIQSLVSYRIWMDFIKGMVRCRKQPIKVTTRIQIEVEIVYPHIVITV